MAFQTIQGNGRIDFIGTDEVDVLSTFNVSQPMYIGGRQADDIVNVFNPLQGVAVSATIQGGQGDDTLSVNNSITTSTVNGNLGNDVLTIAGVLDSSLFAGGGGNDIIGTVAVPIAAMSTATINGNDGNDRIQIEEGAANIGTVGASQILGGKDNDTILIGTTGTRNVNITDTSFNGNDGTDVITCGSVGVLSNITLFGGQGADTISMTQNAASGAGTTATTLSGDIGNDTLSDTAAGGIANIFLGGEGNDTVNAAGGADSVTGGVGADRITVAGNGSQIIYNAVNESFAPTSGTSGEFDVITLGGANSRVNISALTQVLTANEPNIAGLTAVAAANVTFTATATSTWADVVNAVATQQAAALPGGVLLVSGDNGGNRLNGYTITMAGAGVGDFAAGFAYNVVCDTVAGLNNGDFIVRNTTGALAANQFSV